MSDNGKKKKEEKSCAVFSKAHNEDLLIVRRKPKYIQFIVTKYERIRITLKSD